MICFTVRTCCLLQGATEPQSAGSQGNRRKLLSMQTPQREINFSILRLTSFIFLWNATALRSGLHTSRTSDSIWASGSCTLLQNEMLKRPNEPTEMFECWDVNRCCAEMMDIPNLCQRGPVRDALSRLLFHHTFIQAWRENAALIW